MIDKGASPSRGKPVFDVKKAYLWRGGRDWANSSQGINVPFGGVSGLGVV